MKNKCKDAVGNSGDRLDWTLLANELELLWNWVRTTRISRVIVEKFHKTNRDMVTSRGLSRCRDCLMMQLAFTLGVSRMRWQDAGSQIEGHLQRPAVKAMLCRGSREAGCWIDPSRKRVDYSKGKGQTVIGFMAARRKAHKEAVDILKTLIDIKRRCSF